MSEPAGCDEGRRDCSHPRARHEHGTVGGYNHDGCRGAACRAAFAEYRRQYRRRAARMAWSGESIWVSPVGIRRRLQALAAVGWGIEDLGARLGVSHGAVEDLRSGRRDRAFAATAERVSALYEQLSHVVPVGRHHDITRRVARSKGWAPPLAWDEGAIDDPAAVPDFGRSPRARVDVDEVAHLAGAALSAPEIAARLGVRPTAVEAACRRAGRKELWMSLSGRERRPALKRASGE